VPTPIRARLLTGAGALAHDQSDYPAAVAALEQSLNLWRSFEAGPERSSGLAQALLIVANVRLDLNECEIAQPLYEESLALYRELGDTRGAAMALSTLGVLHLERGETDRAAELLNESIQLKRKLGNPYGLAMSLESLGNLERSRGNRERALALCREALALRQELGHRLGIAMSLNNLGHLLLETGDPQEARERLLESLDLFLELEEPRSVIEALTGLAGTMAATGRYEDAARLLAAMDAQREASGFEPRPCEKVVLKRWRGSVRDALDEGRLTTVMREGTDLSLDEVVALARG
jgi:tetratricopeptide (TPR) repeat protein